MFSSEQVSSYDKHFVIEDTIAWVPMNWVQLESEKQLEQFKRLLELLAEEEDVQEVFHNVEGIDDEEE